MKRVIVVLGFYLALSASAQSQWMFPLQQHPELVDYQEENFQTDPEIPAIKSDRFDLSDFLQNPLKTTHGNVGSFWLGNPFATAPVIKDLPAVAAGETNFDSDPLKTAHGNVGSFWLGNPFATAPVIKDLPAVAAGEDETDAEIPAIKKDRFDLSDFLQNHLKTVQKNVGPFSLGHPFGILPLGKDLPGVSVAAGEADSPALDPWQSVFGKIFGNAFKKYLIPINTTIFEHLPPNYKNSTSDTHHIDGSKVVVNQTIHKKTGDDFHHFFHHKVIRVDPHAVTEDEREIEKVTPEGPVVTPSSTEESLIDVVTGHNEIDTDALDFPYETNLKAKPLLKRSVDVLKKSNEISFPPAHTNQFPHSMANNKFLTTRNSKDDGKVSRSWVYKDMGGKSYLYKLSHKNDPASRDSHPETPVINRDAETVGPIRPPDLSRDTRVNPDGSESQQGFSLVEPEAEVFNLTLVIKEAESRANAD